MKRQEQSSASAHFSASSLRHLRSAYQALRQALSTEPWLLQGSVNVVAPKSPGGNVTYTWTRKIRAKTVTVSLSQRQAEAFRAAIAANRGVEQALSRLREASQTALLEHLPGVSRRRADPPRKRATKTVPKGA